MRQNKQLALRDVAEISGLGHTYIRDLELGINRKTGKNITPSSETIKKIAEAYDLDYYDLLDKAGIIDLASLITLRDDKKKTEKKQPSSIPLLSSICSQDELLLPENIADYVYYPLFTQQLPDFAIQMQGNAMTNASIDDCDIVFMRKIKQPEFNGQIVALSFQEDNEWKGTIKRISWAANLPKYTLAPENPNYRTVHVPFNEAVIIGGYMGHFKLEKL